MPTKLKKSKIDYVKEYMSRSDIKDITKNKYISHIKKLYKFDDMTQLNDITIFKPTHLILNTINNYQVSTSTKLNYIGAIMSFLENISEMKDTFQIYQSEFRKMKTEYIKNQNLDEKNDKESANWITQQELKDIYNKELLIYNEIYEKLKNEEKKSIESIQIMQRFFILSLFFHYPGFRSTEFLTLKLLFNSDNKLIEDTKYNYIIYKEYKIIINQYKTSKIYNQQIINYEDNDEFKEIIKKFFKINNFKDGDFIIQTIHNKPLTQTNHITRQLNRILGKRAGSTILRKSNITEEISPEIKSKITNKATQMHHSPATLLKYYVKK